MQYDASAAYCLFSDALHRIKWEQLTLMSNECFNYYYYYYDYYTFEHIQYNT